LVLNFNPVHPVKKDIFPQRRRDAEEKFFTAKNSENAEKRYNPR
jgi:hypothetical protein